MSDAPAPMTAAEVAASLGTDAKTLRRFLRQSSEFRSVGQGRRYAFTTSDVARLRRTFPKWISTHTRGTKATVTKLPAVDRVAALEEKLRDRGLHISQVA